MFSIKNNMFYFIILITIIQIESLNELPPVEDNEIVTTESALRSTVNSIFSILKLKHVKHKARIREFSAIHNFFVSITLQDHDNLKEIAKLTKVNDIDNNTQVFITQLNEVLNEDNKSNEALDDIYVTTHIEAFIKRLEHMKHMYGFKNNAGKLDINTEILKHLNTDTNDLLNVAKGIKKANDSDGNQSEDEFWQPSGRRIYQGHRVRIKRFPFMASVQFFKKFQCGGSIIKSDLVITSASCLQLAWNNRFFRENPAFLSVQVGCDFYEGGDENIAVLEVYFHPGYNPKNLNNNLALMRLTRALKFGRRVRKVKKINIDRNPWKLPETTPGITIIGWGARSSSNVLQDPWSNRLGFAELDFYSLRECQEIYSKEYVTNKNFCAGFLSKGGGACNRDVGGPGVTSGILVGVVSFGSPNCGAPDAPTVFTKVGYYHEWIEEIMEQHVPSAHARTTERPFKITNTIDYSFIRSTPYKTYPIIDNGTDQIPFVPESADNLRTNEQVLFKEFIKTMFGSDEVKEYLDENTDIKAEQAKEDKTEPKQLTTSKVLRTTEPTTKLQEPAIDEDPVGSVRMVTTIEKFDKSDGSHEGVTIPNIFMKYTALDPDQEDEKEAEKNIAKLINDIGIQELMESQSSNDDTKSDEVTPSVAKVGLVNLSDETYDSSSEEDDSGAPLLSLLDVGKEGTDKKETNVGLSIPIEPFRDFTFRQNSTGILDLLSNADLVALLSETVAAEKFKGSLPAKYKIHTVSPYLTTPKATERNLRQNFRFTIT